MNNPEPSSIAVVGSGTLAGTSGIRIVIAPGTIASSVGQSHPGWPVLFSHSARPWRGEDRAHTSITPNRFAIVAHDLQNPLAIIEFSAARLIKDDSVERPIIDQGLQRILRSVRQAERLVKDLLDAATRDSETFDLRFTVVPAAQLLTNARAAGEALVSDACITLDVQSAPNLPKVRVDVDRIAQVFDNLIGNATKFTPNGGRITLRAVVVADEVRFSVADTGRGLSEDDRTRAFAAYWQHDTDRPGRGLGLWICRGIVEAVGGRIWIDAGGGGTTVIFALPSVG